MKRSHVQKGYANTYIAEILIFLSLNYSVKTMNAKLKKLIDSLSKLKRF